MAEKKEPTLEFLRSTDQVCPLCTVKVVIYCPDCDFLFCTKHAEDHDCLNDLNW